MEIAFLPFQFYMTVFETIFSFQHLIFYSKHEDLCRKPTSYNRERQLERAKIISEEKKKVH